MLFDKSFRFTSRHRAQFEISSKVETMLTMIKTFDENASTSYTNHRGGSNSSTYAEDEDMDSDNLDEDILAERKEKRNSGFEIKDYTERHTINEIINREKRLKDYFTKEVIPLFRSQTITFRKENNNEW